jgi:moderate conductance mechanosensitive channel
MSGHGCGKIRATIMAVFDINSDFIDHILEIVSALQTKLPTVLFDFLVGILLIRIAVRGTRLLLKMTHIQTGMRYVLTSILESVLWLLFAAYLLEKLGLGGVIYFFTGSIAAIGIAMAAGGSTLVSDIIAAIFLARDPDFNVGDEVIVGWDPVTQGVIERMDARRIRIRDKDGVLHVIPNSVVERREWVVLNRRAELGALARATKTAQRIGGAALEKSTKFKTKSSSASKNAQ